jgi:hypothetical protein
MLTVFAAPLVFAFLVLFFMADPFRLHINIIGLIKKTHYLLPAFVFFAVYVHWMLSGLPACLTERDWNRYGFDARFQEETSDCFTRLPVAKPVCNKKVLTHALRRSVKTD